MRNGPLQGLGPVAWLLVSGVESFSSKSLEPLSVSPLDGWPGQRREIRAQKNPRVFSKTSRVASDRFIPEVSI